jgi:beta-galactosidase
MKSFFDIVIRFLRAFPLMGARLWCVALAAVCSSTGYAQDGQYVPLTPEQRKTLTHSSQRLIVPLAGEWQRASLAEPDWRRVTLPYSEPTLDEFRYRRSFVIDDILIKKYEWQLYALGCNYRVEVYVNGQYLQSHLGGGVPFAIRIPDSYLVNGNNTLEIVVDNRLDASTTVPLRSTPHEAKVFGGIFRELFLIGMPSVYLSNVDMKTSFNGRDFSTANLEITASLVSGNLFQFIREDSTQAEKIVALQKTGVEVSAELRSVEDTNLVVARSAPSFIEIAANRNAQLKLNLAVVSPRLWSPNAPNLYSLVVTMRRNGAPLDDYIAPVGLYQATIEEVNGKKSLIFNGEPISIKAVSYVEESVLNGATVSVAEYERDVQMLKTLGANVLQIGFSPPHPYLAHLCSKHGILIMTGIGVRGTPASILGKENYVVTAQTIMKDYIAAYQNIPSIFAFGISDKAEEGTEELRNYTQKIREVTRGTSTKLLYKIVYGKTQALDAEGVDFIVFFMTAEDSQEFRAEAERLQTINAKKLSVFAFERLFQPDNHKGYSDPLSVEAKARYIRQRFRILQEYKISDNILIGSFSDYLAERPVLITNNDNQYVVTAGLVSRTRDIRLPYQMAKALFNDEKEPILETGNYKPEIPALYTVVSIAFLILFFVLLNASRRFREDVMRALIRPYNFYADIRDQRILSNVGTLALAIVLSATLGLIISSLLYFLRSNYLLDYALAHFVTSNSVKEFINTVIWQPWASFLLATGIFLAVICALTLFIRLCSFFVQSRIFMGDAFVISVWACLPIGFLLILTAGLYRVFATDTYTLISLGLILYALLWSLYRVLRGTAVIYDVRASRVYIIGLGLLLLVVGSLAIYYDARYSTFAFARYFFAVLYP